MSDRPTGAFDNRLVLAAILTIAVLVAGIVAGLWTVTLPSGEQGPARIVVAEGMLVRMNAGMKPEQAAGETVGHPVKGIGSKPADLLLRVVTALREQPELLEAPDQRPDRDLRLESGQVSAQAEVCAAAEREVGRRVLPLGVAGDVEALRVPEAAGDQLPGPLVHVLLDLGGPRRGLVQRTH